MAEPIAARLVRVRDFFLRDLWQLELHPGKWNSFLMRWLQVVVMIGERFVGDQLLLRASALTYVTSLSVIPLLAVTFSIVQLFDPDNSLAVMVVEALAAGAPEAQEQILDLVRGANITGLGSVGAVVLLFSSILALRHLETTLNLIWGVRKDRSLARRFSDYLAVVIVVPLLIGAALSLGASLAADSILQEMLSVPIIAVFYDLGLSQMPKLLLLLGFSFVYWFFPNTEVRVRSALLGGILAAILFAIAQQAYLGLSVGVAKYNALFGGFAALPLLLVWLYVCWAIVLLGAELSFAHQNLARYRLEVQGSDLDAASLERLAVSVVVDVARAFRDRMEPPNAERLAEELCVSVRGIRSVVDRLESTGIVRNVGDEKGDEGFQLGRPAEGVRIHDILRSIRGDEGATEKENASATRRAVDEVVEEIAQAVSSIADNRTVADLLERIPETPGD